MKLAEEDPTFKTYTDEETGQTIIAGMGELHLEIIVDRLLREFKVEANVGKPQVAYRETATQEARNVEGKFVRQSGGRGQYGHAVINLIPQEAGKGYEFENKIVGGVIPKEYITPIDKASRKPSTRACLRATRSWTSRSSLSTVRTTTSTPPRRRSRSPVRWRSRLRSRRPLRSFSSR